jgi:dimethylhistidine N-methyltransferase
LAVRTGSETDVDVANVHGRLTILRAETHSDSDSDSEREAGRRRFVEAVRDGLTGRLRRLPCQYFYDDAGSALFEKICQLPEYYLTRTEDAILREHAGGMVDLGNDANGRSERPTMIELGSGSAEKTRRLIAAALARYGTLHYVPIDVSAAAVEASCRQLVRTFPTLRVTGFVGDYHASLAGIAARFPGPKLVMFLGSSIGNYEPAEAVALLADVARVMGPDDRFLLGTDLVKDRLRLERAYDDAQGVTARFNRNLLTRINRELGADFAPGRFRHQAVFRADLARVEMHLVSLADQSVTIPAAELTVRLAEGESIHTENSHKYTLESLARLAAESGFVEEAAWTDARGWFRVQRWRVRDGI